MANFTPLTCRPLAVIPQIDKSLAMADSIRETDLYEPVKKLLESQGYMVKGEIGAADIVAMRGGEEPVVVELKTGFSLSLFHQAVERLALCDLVYVAVPRNSTKGFHKLVKRNLALCRRLGIGLLTVRLMDGFVEIHCDPGPYNPRQSKVKKARLLREFARRQGDTTKGGSARHTMLTAYRQDALRCLAHLSANGPTKASHLRDATGVEKAREIMASDHYGWFEPQGKGVYAITERGEAALSEFAPALAAMAKPIEAAQ